MARGCFGGLGGSGMKILVFCSTYVPAFRSGGTVRAIAALVDRLGTQFEFWILTRDRDDGGEPYRDVERGRWQRQGNAQVYYAPPRDLTPPRMARIVSEVRPRGYYVNSFLSPLFATVPVALRWFGRLPRGRLCLAPRGEFHTSALALGWAKKKAFVLLARNLPAYRDLLWQASGPEEKKDILRVFPRAEVVVARDLTDVTAPSHRPRPEKQVGALSLAYLSRVTPIKNLAWGIRALRRVRGSVELTVYGPALEARYLRECKEAIATLPSNVRVRFAGAVPHERVVDTLAGHHVFFLPSLSESFGHSIVESMVAGAVPMLSDRTPWRGLRAKGLGWDVALEENAFASSLQEAIDMSDAEFAQRRARVIEFGLNAARDPAAVDQNRALMERLGNQTVR